jgi:hypothetical protein
MANDIIAIVVLIVIGLWLYMHKTGNGLRDIVTQLRDAFKR